VQQWVFSDKSQRAHGKRGEKACFVVARLGKADHPSPELGRDAGHRKRESQRCVNGLSLKVVAQFLADW
jgi:hypothetical protein